MASLGSWGFFLIVFLLCVGIHFFGHGGHGHGGHAGHEPEGRDNTVGDPHGARGGRGAGKPGTGNR